MRKHRPNSQINVQLVDDHTLARDSHRKLLALDSRLNLLGEDENAAGLQLRFQDPLPDVIVLDISLPGMSGIDTLQQVINLRPATSRILMLSQYKDPLYVSRALQVGAHGYVTKSSAPELLLSGIRAVAKGRQFVSPDVEQVLSATTEPVAEIASALSAREHDILRLLCAGLPLDEIAQRLGISSKTVANRQTAIKQKLGANSAVQLVVIARRLGLFPTVEAIAIDQHAP